MGHKIIERFRNILHRIGRRGAFLLWLAIVDGSIVMSMTSYNDYGPEVERVLRIAYAGHLLLLPFEGWAVVWTVMTALLVFYAFRRYDKPAYVMAAGIKFAWATLYLWSWYLHSPRAWAGFFVWITFSGIVLINAGWRERGKNGD